MELIEFDNKKERLMIATFKGIKRKRNTGGLKMSETVLSLGKITKTFWRYICSIYFDFKK